MDGFALVVEVVGDGLVLRRDPPPPVLPAMPVDKKRASRLFLAALEAAAEADREEMAS